MKPLKKKNNKKIFSNPKKKVGKTERQHFPLKRVPISSQHFFRPDCDCFCQQKINQKRKNNNKKISECVVIVCHCVGPCFVVVLPSPSSRYVMMSASVSPHTYTQRAAEFWQRAIGKCYTAFLNCNLPPGHFDGLSVSLLIQQFYTGFSLDLLGFLYFLCTEWYNIANCPTGIFIQGMYECMRVYVSHYEWEEHVQFSKTLLRVTCMRLSTHHLHVHPWRLHWGVFEKVPDFKHSRYKLYFIRCISNSSHSVQDMAAMRNDRLSKRSCSKHLRGTNLPLAYCYVPVKLKKKKL